MYLCPQNQELPEKKMKSIASIVGMGLLVLASCQDNIEQKANEYLLLAKQAYNKGAYEVAREKIDSIRLLYPKAFEARRQGLELRLKVDLAEGKQAVAQADKIIQDKSGLVDRLKSKMVLEPRKGTVGTYVSPLQTLDKIGHNMLRAQVDEHGMLTLTSIHCGRMDHRSVKVTAPDGSSLQTPSSQAFFTVEKEGQLLEEVVYSNDREVGLSAFIAKHLGKELKMTFIARDRSETVTLQPEDVKAVTDIYDLYLQMQVLNDARVHYADACEKVKFIHRKMKDGEAEQEAGK